MCDYNTISGEGQGIPKGKGDDDLAHVKRVALLVHRLCDLISDAKKGFCATDREIKTAIKIITERL